MYRLMMTKGHESKIMIKLHDPKVQIKEEKPHVITRDFRQALSGLFLFYSSQRNLIEHIL